MDTGAWWARVHGVAKSWTRLTHLASRGASFPWICMGLQIDISLELSGRLKSSWEFCTFRVIAAKSTRDFIEK